MALKKSVRLTLDIAMTILLLCAYAFQIIGDTVHIWVGIGIFVLFTLHIFLNRHWFKTLFKGTYTPRRILTTAVNILLALAVVTLLITGILEARWDTSFLQLETGVTIRQIHTTAAYWLWALIGIHLGFHWGMFSKFVGKNSLTITLMRILTFIFASFGVWSFFDRDMFAKLFLGFSFDYWSDERPIILFFAETLSVMGVFVFITYYSTQLIDWLKNKQSKTINGGFL